MSQGAAQGPWSGGKPAVAKAISPSKGTLAVANTASAPSAAKSVAKPGPGAPSAPRAQPRSLPTIAGKSAASPHPSEPTTRVAAPMRKPAPTPVRGADDGVSEVDGMVASLPRVAGSSPSAAALVAAQLATRPPAGPPVLPREDIGPIVRSMVEQAMVPLDRAMRSMVEQATAPLDRAMRSMVEQATAPLDRTVRAAVEQAMAPLDRAVRDLQRRLEEVERRSPPAPVAAGFQNNSAVRALDIAAIERSVTLGPELHAFDGRRRRLRLGIGVVLMCLVVFAGLFAALAQSYTHTHP